MSSWEETLPVDLDECGPGMNHGLFFSRVGPSHFCFSCLICDCHCVVISCVWRELKSMYTCGIELGLSEQNPNA